MLMNEKSCLVPSIDLRVAGLEKLAFPARVKCEMVLHDRTNVDTTMITV